LLASGASRAQDNGIYVGGSAADVSADYDWPAAGLTVTVDDAASGFKLIGGARPFDKLAVEANYVDLGTASAPLGIACPAVIGFPCASGASIEASAISVSALGMLTLPLLDLYGRLGVAKWKAEGDVRFTGVGGDLTTRTTREGSDPTYGVGIQLRFSSVALRVEWERFEILDDSAESVSVGFTYTFL
jgi:hypothetical protein